MKEPTRPNVKTKAPRIEAPGKTASRGNFEPAASEGDDAELAKWFAQIEKAARTGNPDDPKEGKAHKLIRELVGGPVGNAEGELVDPFLIHEAAESGNFSKLAKFPSELKLAQALRRKYLSDGRPKPKTFKEKQQQLREQLGSFLQKVRSSGYNPPTPQQEGRTAGDTHAANDLRHERHVTGARAETTQRQPKQLSSHELRKFLAHAKAHPWDSKGDVGPSDHIKKTFARWLKLGLARTDIIAAQENLAQAYSTEISRNPDRRIEELVVRPHSLPPGAKRALSTSLVSELTPQELEQKRAIEREKKQRQRSRPKSAKLTRD
jgi:hypothetical protein